jgi:uncharacterized protein with GYD domain
MAHYLVQVAYTPEAWAAMVKNPQDRTEAIRPAIEKLGGRVETVYLAFGDYDLVSIIEFPDNVSSAAFSLAASAGGACKTLKTTPLLTAAEGMDAMKQASDLGYKPPK